VTCLALFAIIKFPAVPMTILQACFYASYLQESRRSWTTQLRCRRSKLSFLHHIRLVPLFSSILGGIILLFALSSGLAGYFLLKADTDQQDVTSEIQVRLGLSNSSNHLRTARINMIHAGAASRIAEMDAMKQNISEAETRIKQSQEDLTRT
jgi:methyl-accepting chemotaxis protein-3 (ribose and galactose sensor receptor)